ncbi:WHG domain-containing protein [Modestobacter sp. SSW1-42]|uniref:TetR/AcrR family transcriptional regulator n=1 Tax=Modestobacter sp. SSW1-42 TaxID=596372 RepID=UPI003985D3ED
MADQAPRPLHPVDTPGGGSPGRQRNRRGEGARLRADILDAAAAILGETGNEQAVTLRAVARRVGIAAPSIYPHFADRQAILMALVHGAFTDLETQLTAAAQSAAEPVARLRAVCTAYLRFAGSRPRHYNLMFGGVWSAAAAQAEGAITSSEAIQLGQEALAIFVAALRACVDAGRSTSDDPQADAVALWVALHGLAHQRAVATAFPWPDGMEARLIGPIAHLT